ncbi:MAG TPA: ABC transporter ATP-binding protein, partial [Lachnospiraceae bacterium]|nr:ABC transporter ATP-binding protein [Lachnospiraceae bacterium]
MIHSSKEIKKVIHPDRILSYFKLEFWSLTLVTLSGVIYNVGMIAGPYFEGRLTQCLFNIMRGTQGFTAMLPLTAIYLVVILVVQLMRCIKRFYVRKFANNT